MEKEELKKSNKTKVTKDKKIKKEKEKKKTTKTTKTTKKTQKTKVVKSIAPLSYVYNDKINISIEEVDKIFPDIEKKDNLNSSNKENKDYTIIRLENGKVEELNRYKFLYDLFIWKKFYSVCDTVDSSFNIKDDNLEKNIKNGVEEDITIRDVKYKRQNKIYVDELINKYNKNLYDEYVKERTIDEDSVNKNDEYVKRNRYIYLVFAIILLLCSLFVVFSHLLNLNLFDELIKYIISGSSLLLTIIFVILFITHKKIVKVKRVEKVLKVNTNLKSFDDFVLEKQNNEEYVNKIEEMKKQYLDDLKRYEEMIYKYREVLIYIKEKLMLIIPLAKDCYNKEMINSLINVSIERNCDTIRKALKYAKEDDYKTEYLSSLEMFNKSMFYLEDYKLFIDEYNNLKKELKDEFDEKINNNNIIIDYFNNIKIDKIIVNSDKYLKK